MGARVRCPFVFGVFAGQLQRRIFDPDRECVFGDDKAVLAPQRFRIPEAVRRDAAAGVERRIAARDRDACLFKGFPPCGLDDGRVFVLSAARDELPDVQIFSSERAESHLPVRDAIGNDQNLISCPRHNASSPSIADLLYDSRIAPKTQPQPPDVDRAAAFTSGIGPESQSSESQPRLQAASKRDDDVGLFDQRCVVGRGDDGRGLL